MLIQTSQIALNDIRVYAYHGALAQEQTVGAWYSVSLRIDYPLSAAMASDRLSDTLSYADVYALVRDVMAVRSALLEHVAARLLQALFATFPQITGAEIELRKENPPLCGETSSAAVIIKAKK